MIYPESHGRAEDAPSMKRDPYMMSTPEYDTRIKRVRRRKDDSIVLIGLGIIAVLVSAMITLIGSLLYVCFLGILLMGLALVVGGVALLVSMRTEERRLERWRTWEVETQARMRE